MISTTYCHHSGVLVGQGTFVWRPQTNPSFSKGRQLKIHPTCGAKNRETAKAAEAAAAPSHFFFFFHVGKREGSVYSYLFCVVSALWYTKRSGTFYLPTDCKQQRHAVVSPLPFPSLPIV
jgi:hypothetical protein